MIVEMGKEYRLADGRKYRLFCVDGGRCYPVLGAYWDEGAQEWLSICHTSDGRYLRNEESSLDDLVSTVPRIKGEFWVVHFLGGPLCKTFQTQQEAQMWAGASKNVIAITHHTYDCEEGEGLK
jgi:hypothetical protein